MPRGHWRLFVALPLPEAAASAIEVSLASFRKRHPDARWIPSRYLHLTLVFLGEVAPDDAATAVRLIDESAVRREPFDLELAEGSGRPGHDGDGVAWLRLGRGSEEVIALSAALLARLAPADPRRAAGDRPHLTVARRASRAVIEELRTWRPRQPIGWQADRIALFRSHLGPHGARYELVHTSNLAGGAD